MAKRKKTKTKSKPVANGNSSNTELGNNVEVNALDIVHDLATHLAAQEIQNEMMINEKIAKEISNKPNDPKLLNQRDGITESPSEGNGADEGVPSTIQGHSNGKTSSSPLSNGSKSRDNVLSPTLSDDVEEPLLASPPMAAVHLHPDSSPPPPPSSPTHSMIGSMSRSNSLSPSSSSHELSSMKNGNPRNSIQRRLSTTLNVPLQARTHLAQKSGKEDWIPYVLFCFAGIGLAGLHRFWLRRYITGFIYLITWGLFGIGTIYDLVTFKQLIEEAKCKTKTDRTIEPLSRLTVLLEEGDLLALYQFFRTQHLPSLIGGWINLKINKFYLGLCEFSSGMFNVVTTAILTLLPLHWIFLVMLVATFSIGWAFAMGGVLFAYPQVMWERREKRPIRLWKIIKESPLFSPLFQYFPIELSRTTPLDSSKKYLFGYHPHGVYSFGLFTVVFPKLSGFDKLFPGISCVTGVANSLLCIPILCTIFGWLGFIPASPRSMQSALNQGYNIVIVPGGIAEMIEGSDDDVTNKETVYLRSRKGFVRFALKNGLCLVPVFGFGENKTFKRYSGLKKLRMLLSRKLRITIQLFSGRWYTLIPFNQPINVVVGKPVEVSHPVADPSDDEVNAILKSYEENLRELYEQNKEYYGYQDVELRVL